MENGDLLIQGKRADELDIEAFTDSTDMTNWEMGFTAFTVTGPRLKELSIYDEYDKVKGEKYCEKNNINEMKDIFGQEFADRFYKHKHMLVAKELLPELYKERDELNRVIKGYEERADINDVVKMS